MVYAKKENVIVILVLQVFFATKSFKIARIIVHLRTEGFADMIDVCAE